MLAARSGSGEVGHQPDDVWRALANPTRRQLLDELRSGPRTTGELAEGVTGLTRFAIMQHLGVLTDAGLVVVRRRGRQRFNHLNPVPLREWYERWVTPLADSAAEEMIALERHINERGGQDAMVANAPETTEQIRAIRIETELRFKATPERIFEAITERSREWFPATYGGERVQQIVLEPFVGGRHYEDWGEGRGHLYGHVTLYDPPDRLSVRSRLDAGTILDRMYEIEQHGDESVLRSSRVAVGPFTDEQAAGIHKYGDLANFEDGLRRVIEG